MAAELKAARTVTGVKAAWRTARWLAIRRALRANMMANVWIGE